MNFYDSLTDFIFIEMTPRPADIIFIPGGPYGEIALHAAKLYEDGYAPLILVSGRYSILTDRFQGPLSPSSYQTNTYETEAGFLSHVLACRGVPQQAILQETKASHTYENAIYSRSLTDRLGLTIQTAILSCQAYHARRCLLYYQLLYPDTDFYVCPAVTRNLTRDNWHQSPEGIDLVLGEVERCGKQFHTILKNKC